MKATVNLEGLHRREEAVKHFNDLTPSEAERLAVLLEEMGEAQQAIGKILRHGYGSLHPAEMDGLDNRERLEKEIGDVLAAIEMMTNVEDLNTTHIDKRRRQKHRNVQKYLHHQ